MLDPKLVAQAVEEQIKTLVSDQVLKVFESDAWLRPIEEKIIKFTQDRILGKFANADAMPELAEAVKKSVAEMFTAGRLPGLDQYIDSESIKQTVDFSVEQYVNKTLKTFNQDPVWREKIETLINQNIVRRTISSLNSVDIKNVINQRVDEVMIDAEPRIVQQLTRPGIEDRASKIELTVLDDHVVIENNFTARNVEVVNALNVQDLVVAGSINTDNNSWNDLKDFIAARTLKQINDQWRSDLVEQVKKQITTDGIDFDTVKVNNEPLISNGNLAKTVIGSNLQSVGVLSSLRVSGESNLSNTVNIANKRVGINTASPEMALSVWDEEVSLIAGKLKADTAYLGTGRVQNLVIGVNRDSAITVESDSMVTVKKLRVGTYQISHATTVPGYSGTKGDIVFNSNPDASNPVLGWMCLGGFRWKVLRLVE
jgi:hypothetical protein